MRSIIVVGVVAGVVAAFVGPGGSRGGQVKPAAEEQPKLWVAVSMSHFFYDPYTFNIKGPEIHLEDDMDAEMTTISEMIGALSDAHWRRAAEPALVLLRS